nr:hypothetical protein [Tanacetum cinerariifolium]
KVVFRVKDRVDLTRWYSSGGGLMVRRSISVDAPNWSIILKKSDNRTMFSDEVKDDEDYGHDGHDSTSSGKYNVLAVCQIVHYARGLSFLTAICLIRQMFVLKTLSHSDLGNKHLPISFFGSDLVLYLHSDLPTLLSSGFELTTVDTVAVYSSDTQPNMLDRTDFASWQQCILYCRGKENGVNIFKSIDEGPFQIGTFRETLVDGEEGALHLDIRDNVKMLLEGSELTKEDQESQMYDDVEHLCQNIGETIHDYYVRFAKLINDMRNIKMTMSIMQLNSKFVNNMLPE